MLEAAFWGFVGGGALLLGAALAVLVPVPNRVIGLVMGFGTGVLISAAAFELTVEGYELAGGTPVVLGLLAGGLTFYAGDAAIDRVGGHRRKSPGGPAAGAGAAALVLGSMLDGIPESAAIGVTLLGGGAVGLPVVAAVFLSNVPESLSATKGMLHAGRTPRYVVTLWVGVAAVCTIASALGYAVLGGAGDTALAATQAFAAGAILTMLADTMVPEAVEHAGSLVGLVTVLGFVAAFLLSVA